MLAQHSKYKEETALVQREMQAKVEELLRSNAGLVADKEQAISQHQTTTEAMRAQMNEAVANATEVANEAQKAAGTQVVQLQSVIAWLGPVAIQAGLNLCPLPDCNLFSVNRVELPRPLFLEQEGRFLSRHQAWQRRSLDLHPVFLPERVRPRSRNRKLFLRNLWLHQK